MHFPLDNETEALVELHFWSTLLFREASQRYLLYTQFIFLITEN